MNGNVKKLSRDVKIIKRLRLIARLARIAGVLAAAVTAAVVGTDLYRMIAG